MQETGGGILMEGKFKPLYCYTLNNKVIPDRAAKSLMKSVYLENNHGLYILSELGKTIEL